MGELAKFSGGMPANPDDLVQGLQNVSAVVKGGTGGVPYLRLLKSGVFAFGAENIEPEDGSEWAVNPYSLHHGFACWGDGELVDERMVAFTEPPPNKAELPDYGYDWNQQIAMHLQCVSGEDEGTTVLYKGTSTGLRNAFRDLVEAMLARLKKDQVNYVPVITLDVDSYQHKKYGEIFVPIFDIVKWVSMDGVGVEAADEAADDEDDEEPEAPPKRRGRKAKASEDADDKPAPRANRRRRRK